MPSTHHRPASSNRSRARIDRLEAQTQSSSRFSAFLKFCLASILAGLLTAGFVVPFAALASTTARVSADSLQHLPAEFGSNPQPQRSQIFMADGSVMATFFDENREYVPLDKISPVMRQAQIAIEDNRFYSHGAIDLRGTMRALVSNMGEASTQGGSTLTQQYVKQARIEMAVSAGDEEGVRSAQEQTVSRKLQELRYAIALEHDLSKDQILERYLNIAYYGDGAYGVEAAAKHYFGVTADKLDLGQAAMLAGLVQNPVSYDPVNNPEAAITRRNVVLTRMKGLGLVSEKDVQAAMKQGFNRSRVTYPKTGCISSKYPFVCNYVYQSLLSSPNLGKTRAEREKLVKRGGLEIHTLIDPKAQDSAQEAVSNWVGPTDPVLGGVATIQPGTGLIMAMAQSRPEMGTKSGQTYYNYLAPLGLGGFGGFQAGSTFKAYTLAAALEHGIPISKHYYAGSPMDFTGETFQGCKGKVRSGPFSVSNSTGHSGTMGLRAAAAYSVNTYFVQLERDAGLCNVTKMAKKTGVELASGKDIVKEYGSIPSFTLGTAYVTPLSMASSYATFAARGVHCDPVIVKSIKNKDGQNLKVPDANCKRVMSTQVADGVNEVLKGVMNGTGAPARIPGGYPQAGKTGTTDSNEAVWFTGYTPAVAGAAFIAADSSSEHFRGREVRSIRGLHMSTGKYLKGSGGGDAGQIYRKAMAATLEDKPRKGFSETTDEIRHGKKVPVPSTSGMNYDEAKKTLEDAGFDTRTKRVHSEKSKGTFLGADPDGGKAPQGSTIDLRVSSGPRQTYQRRAPQRDRWQQWQQQQQPGQQQQDPWQQQQQQPAPAEPPRYTQQPR